MMKITSLFIMIFVSTVNLNCAMGEESESSAIWNKISAFFSPPAELKNKPGEYRSPLKFYGGRVVKTPEDWEKRRDEILARWNGMMGS